MEPLFGAAAVTGSNQGDPFLINISIISIHIFLVENNIGVGGVVDGGVHAAAGLGCSDCGCQATREDIKENVQDYNVFRSRCPDDTCKHTANRHGVRGEPTPTKYNALFTNFCDHVLPYVDLVISSLSCNFACDVCSVSAMDALFDLMVSSNPCQHCFLHIMCRSLQTAALCCFPCCFAHACDACARVYVNFSHETMLTHYPGVFM